MAMRSSRARRLFVALAAFVVLLPALWGPRDAAAQTGEPYKIGVTYPLSGPQAAWGLLLLPAAEIAVQQINAAGGVGGRPLALVVEDSKGNPEGGVSAMRKVVEVDHVATILSLFTNVVSAQIPVADQLKVSVVSTVESPGLVSRSQWTFAHGSFISQTVPLVAAHWKRQGVKRVFAFLPNGPIAQFATEAVKGEIEKNKLGIEYDQALFKLGDSDFRGLITRAKSFKPDAILIYGYGSPEEGLIMKQIRELGMNTQIYAGCGCITSKSYREAAGKAAEGVIFGSFKYDVVAAKKFVDAYRAKLGFDPDYACLEVYDIIHMMAQAIKANGYSGDGIRRGLTEIKDFHSIGGGVVTMGANRQTVVPVALYVLKDAVKPTFVEITP